MRYEYKHNPDSLRFTKHGSLLMSKTPARNKSVAKFYYWKCEDLDKSKREDRSYSPENARGSKPEWTLPTKFEMNWRGSYMTEKSTSYGTFGSNPL